MERSFELEIEGLRIEVERKNIKNLRLSIYPPDGRVHVSAPAYLREADIRSFVLSKWDWILTHRREALEQPRQTVREYVSGENHYLFGERYLLKVEHADSSPYGVKVRGKTIVMRVRKETGREARKAALELFYRAALEEYLTLLVAMWSAKLREPLVDWQIRQMRTMWGSCTPARRSIRFNLELARVPSECIEYVVVHELTHLKVRNHGKAFQDLMTQRLPRWRELRKELNDFAALYRGDIKEKEQE